MQFLGTNLAICLLSFVLPAANTTSAEDIVFVGCFYPASTKVENKYKMPHLLSWQECINFCLHRLTLQAGIQAGKGSLTGYNHCFCGDDMDDQSTVANSTDCLPCEDNDDKYCGTEAALSLYQLRNSTPLALLLATGGGIELFFAENTSTTIVQTDNAHYVDYYYEGDEIFFISGTYLYSSSLDPSLARYARPKAVLDWYYGLSGLALDWKHKHIYFGSSRYEKGYNNHIYSIYVMDLSGANKNGLQIFADGFEDLTFDPHEKLVLFIAGGDLYSYKIGDQYEKKYSKLYLEKVITVALDVYQKIIYIIGSQNDVFYLERMTYEGRDIKKLYSGPLLRNAFSMDVFRNEVVWVISHEKHFTIFKCHLTPKCSNHNVTLVHSWTEQVIYNIKIYHPKAQVLDVHQICALLNCSHTCTDVSQDEVICTCPKDMWLSADKRTCIGLSAMVYIGCFSEYSAEIQQYRLHQSLMWQECVQVCDQRLVRLVAIQSGQSLDLLNRCFCGHNLEEYLKGTNNSKCFPCLDKKDTYCGGDKTLSLYQLRESTPISFLLATDTGVKMLNSEISVLMEKIAYNSTVTSLDFYYSGDDILFISGNKMFSYYYSASQIKYVALDFEKSTDSNHALAIDWVYNKTYWSDYNSNDRSNQIYEAGLDGNHTNWIQTMYPSTNLSLALDPYKRLLFYTDSEILYSFELDSKNIRTYKNGKHRLRTVKTFALNIVQEMIYALGTEGSENILLVSVDYEDTTFRVLYSGRELKNPVGIAVLKEDVFWLNHKDNWYTIYKCHLAPICYSIHLTVVYQSREPVYDMKLYHPEVQMPNTTLLCRKLRCSHDCSTTALPLIKCSCPGMMVIGADNRTCEYPPTTVLPSSVTATTKNEYIDPEVHLRHILPQPDDLPSFESPVESYDEDPEYESTTVTTSTEGITDSVPVQDPVPVKTKDNTSGITFIDAFMIAGVVLIISLLMTIIYLNTRPTNPESNPAFTYRHAAEMDELTNNYNM